MRRYRRLFTASLLAYLAMLPIELGAVRFTPAELFGVDQSVVAQALTSYARRNQYPDALSLTTPQSEFQARISYTFDVDVQAVVDAVFRRYRPDYGAFVAIRPDTGEVLALASWEKNGSQWGNLALHNDYPAASVFKIVTAAAALDQGKVEPDTVLPFNGKRSSLYKRQVFRHRDNKWTRRPTLTKAFAQSVNTVFARLGVMQLGAETLQEYAERFGFNREFNRDVLVAPSHVALEPDDEWALAEAASGFTRDNKLSPWHGAMLASAAVNRGVMQQPYIVESVTDENGVLLYRNEPRAMAPSMTPATARKLRRLMRETVRRGSARVGFRKFFRGHMKDVEVGGKTGSLTGKSPKGKNDWFVGYAAKGDRKIAYAALTVNEKRWTVKSAYVARKVIEAYFSPREG